MKLIVFILLFSSIAEAKWFPFGKPGANTGYKNKAKCEQIEGQNCFDISNLDLRKFKIVNGQLVLDPVKEAIADAEDQAKADEFADRTNKYSQRDLSLKQCVRAGLKVPNLDPGSASINQMANRQNKLKNCLALIIKEVLEKRLGVEDL
jgi:hypothetical protein